MSRDIASSGAGRGLLSTAGRLALLAVLLAAGHAWCQSGKRELRLSYVYPAGGQPGSTVHVLASGQAMMGSSEVFVSGEGVHGSVVECSKPLTKDTIKEVRQGFNQLLRMRRAGNTTDSVEFPDHPWLRKVNQMSLRELEYWMAAYFREDKKQATVQLANMVSIDVTIDADARPGTRDLRIASNTGLSNPLRFEVGTAPEVCEREPNDRDTAELGTVETPVVLNGQIMPGDADRFRFRAAQGQLLVLTVQARALLPYLADAVPGWFQPVLALYDVQGRELAHEDDYRFEPDPVLCFRVPETGEYDLEIRDSIYRGRDDFVYRLSVAEQPFITEVFPLGARTGEKAGATINGWNLPTSRLPFDTRAGEENIRVASVQGKAGISNAVRYAVDALPECEEHESNDGTGKPQSIKLPRVVNGRIGCPGDVDVFKFKGHRGEPLVAEVYARRLHTPLDSLLRLMDESGKVVAWNDDVEDKGEGLLTHAADSYVSVTLPEDGVYYLQLSDAQQHGGDEYTYRLRVSPPQPDFALRMTPSSLYLRPGYPVAITVYVLRKDGFAGDVTIAMREPGTGFVLDGARIPAERDHVRMTVTATGPCEQPVLLCLEGHGRIGESAVTRPIVPCENMMQAFAYWHLVPSQALLAAVKNVKGRIPKIAAGDPGPARIPAGGTAQVTVAMPKVPPQFTVHFELSDPPKGVALQDVTLTPGGALLVLKSDGDSLKPGYADNLIVEGFLEKAAPEPETDGKPAKMKQRVSAGVLPAIPFEIVP